MAFNYQNVKTGGLAPKTYLVFVGLMVLAPLSSLLLSPPEKVQRTDGSPVPSFPKESMWVEFKETMKTLKDPKIISRTYCNCVAALSNSDSVGSLGPASICPGTPRHLLGEALLRPCSCSVVPRASCGGNHPVPGHRSKLSSRIPAMQSADGRISMSSTRPTSLFARG